MAAGPVAAALSTEFAKGVDLDDAFSLGLLHDIGKTALANSHHDEYEEIVSRATESTEGFTSIERETFGFDHAELGALVVEGWGFPARAVSVIRHHHDPSALETLPPPEAQLTAIVSIATACLTRLGAGRPAPVEGIDVSELPAWRFLGLDQSRVEGTLEICAERIEAARAFAG